MLSDRLIFTKGFITNSLNQYIKWRNKNGRFFSLLLGGIVGFVGGIVIADKAYDIKTALKLSNVMSASMLDCVTHKIITQEQVYDIEDVFFKHIELNFKGIKAQHSSDEEK